MPLKLSQITGTEVSFDLKSIHEGHHRVTYRGLTALRSPFDYVIYQMIICEVQPDLIIEIGTNFGGSAYYMADLLECLGKGVVHSIDIEDKASGLLSMHPRIQLFTHGWEQYDIELAKEFEKIIVIEDSSHSFENTLNVMNRFSPLVSCESYLIVEDGIITKLKMAGTYNGGPLAAISTFLKQHDEFVIDRRWCDMFGRNATFNVNGYLKRTK